MRPSRSLNIILASGSSKRKELLEQLGISFTVDASNCREDMTPRIDPRVLAKNLSRKKARCVAVRHPKSLIIAGDTFGVLGKRIFGKAQNPIEARETLRLLSGRMHRAITGVTVIDTTTGKEQSIATETRVWFRKILPNELEWYIRSGEWREKAACYTLMGKASVFIKKIEGDTGSVLGLPMCALVELLKEFGVRV